MPERNRFFRGSEFTRLLLLLGLAAAGWAWVWNATGTPADSGNEPLRVEGPPPPIETDRSLAFEGVTDKTPLGLLDNAAYGKLLEQARERSPEQLAGEARRDVGFAHLWDRPEQYRGVPVHLLGAARRVLRYDSKLAKGGWLHEVWLFTPESQSHPYVCVFEEVPKGFPIGDNLSERVVFNGYFMKLMRYQAGDTVRAAPLLVGRIGWTERSSGGTWSIRSTAGVAIVMGCLLTLSLVRWLFRLRWATRSPIRTPLGFDRPTDEIDPEALADWVQNLAENPGVIEGEGSSPEGEDRPQP